MKIAELGQFGMIDTVAKMVQETRDNLTESWRDLLIGIGDDCAVWKSAANSELAKVDCQVDGIHFNIDIISWEELGWKSLAVNLSDIAAMGGIPRYALVSLGLPPDTEVENVISLYKGMLKLARLSGTAVAGGNMSGSRVIFVDVCVIGRTGNPEGKFLSRSSAKPGDLIAVTGWLGTAAAGLEMLTHKLKMETSVSDGLRQAFTRPEPRLEEGRLLIAQGVNTATDISDGLLADLGHICQASQVGAIIEFEKLPIRPEVKSAFGERSFEMALSGGEDYQLLFTAGPQIIEKVRRSSTCPMTIIGEITAENSGQVILTDAEGKRVQPRMTGWDHFKHSR
jgi:thiamine-monophosphate kinase